MVVAQDQIEKEFIYFSQIANGISDIRSFVKGTYRGSKVFKIKKYFNKIEFVTQSSSFYFDPKNNISKAADANISEGIMASLKIEGIDKEKGLYLIDANNLFLKETFSQIKPARHPKESATAFSLGKLDQDKTKINGIRNYPQNTDLAIEYVYSNESILNSSVEIGAAKISLIVPLNFGKKIPNEVLLIDWVNRVNINRPGTMYDP